MALNLYEAMFLVDSARGGSQFSAVVQHISELIERHEGKVERIERWAERKLAYPIKHVEKGIYVLPIVYPMVPRGKARIRVQLCSEHTKEQLDRAIKAFKEGGEKLGLI